jgi:hypothetical protein
METEEPQPPITFAGIREQFRRSPVLALISAITIGFFVGALLRCFERERAPKSGKPKRV